MLDTILRPATDWELARVLADAREAQRPLEIAGGGSKAAYGCPGRPAQRVSLQVMRGIKALDQTSGIVTVQAGTPLSDLETELALDGLMLPFEPIDIAPLFGGEIGRATIGGTIATNLAGSRRVALGSIADAIAGLRLATGGGEIVAAGRAVMAGRSGLDFRRLVPGSFGTLGVIADVSLKAVPLPARSVTLVLLGLQGEIAIEAMGDALARSPGVTGAVHLDAAMVARAWHDDLRAQREPATLIRCEASSDRAIEAILGRVGHALGPYGDVHRLDDDESAVLWQEVRVLSFLQNGTRPVWRLAVLPSRAHEMVRAIRRYVAAEAIYEWGGGLVWLEVAESADAGATDIRRVTAQAGGSATLVRAPDAVRASVDVFEPLDPGKELLSQRLKAVFDPGGILNAGRIYRNL